MKCPYKKCIGKAKQGERTRASGNQSGGNKNNLLTLENGETVERFEFYSERGNNILIRYTWRIFFIMNKKAFVHILDILLI